MFDPELKPGPRPDERSLVVAEALEIFEGSICSGCGQSALLAYDPRNTGEWECQTTTCEACLILEQDPERERRPAGEVRYLAALFE